MSRRAAARDKVAAALATCGYPVRKYSPQSGPNGIEVWLTGCTVAPRGHVIITVSVRAPQASGLQALEAAADAAQDAIAADGHIMWDQTDVQSSATDAQVIFVEFQVTTRP